MYIFLDPLSRFFFISKLIINIFSNFVVVVVVATNLPICSNYNIASNKTTTKKLKNISSSKQ